MSNTLKWKIYYSDHAKDHDTSVSSEQATPFSITRRADVQVIVFESHDHKWRTLSGYDYYYWDSKEREARWWGVDIFGLHHYLLQPGHKCVLFGTIIDKDRFNEIFNMAREDMLFLQPKVIFANDERQP